MKVIESFSQGKSPDPSKNEDRLVVTDDFIAVIDGSTSKSGKKIDGKTGGVFAVDFAVGFINALPFDANADTAIAGLTSGLKQATADTGLFAEGEELPTFVFAIYSRHRQEIWRVGDIAIALDGKVQSNEKEMDSIAGSARSVFIELALKQGASVADIAANDIGRQFILPILNQQHLFANRSGTYCYGVVNGSDIPAEFINVIDADAANEIIMASDGYPDVISSLSAAEDALAHILSNDPLLYKLHRSTKGLQPGNRSFDDRTYIRFTP